MSALLRSLLQNLSLFLYSCSLFISDDKSSTLDGRRNGAPIMNEYKRKFFLRRWLKTWLGGIEVRKGAPSRLYVAEGILFLSIIVVGISLSFPPSLHQQYLMSQSSPSMPSLSLLCSLVFAFFTSVLCFAMQVAALRAHQLKLRQMKTGEKPFLMALEDEVGRCWVAYKGSNCAFGLP